MIRRACLSLLLVAAGSGAHAQAPTPEEIAALVDQRIASLNPYAELLNDPDPERSLAAMQIMLESGDANLTRMALEFGLFSPNPAVRRTAVEAYLKSSPILTLRFEGGEEPHANFAKTMNDYYSGSTDPGNIGYWKIPVGDFSDESGCFLHAREQNGCFVTINSDGIYLTHDQYSLLAARTHVNDEGQLQGYAKVYAVNEPVPVTVNLID